MTTISCGQMNGDKCVSFVGKIWLKADYKDSFVQVTKPAILVMNELL